MADGSKTGAPGVGHNQPVEEEVVWERWSKKRTFVRALEGIVNVLERDDAGSFWVTVKGQNPVLVNGRIIPRERSIGVDVGQVIEICSYSIKIR